MKNLSIKTLLIAFLAMISFIGCKKSDDKPITPVATFAGVKFKANGTSYEWPLAQFGFQLRKILPQGTSSVTYSNGGFELNGAHSKLSLKIDLPIGTTLRTGTFTNTEIHPFLNNGVDEYLSRGDCTTVITKVSNGLCSGTFSGTAYSYPTNQPLIITEGTFTDIPVLN